MSLNAAALADDSPPLCRLVVKEAWDGLTKHEKLYAHHVSKASWAGARIILSQGTHRSEELFDCLLAVFGAKALPELKSNSKVTDNEFDSILSYTAQFLSNLSNYKSFGNTKFIPRVSSAVFESVVRASGSAAALASWENVKAFVYDLDPPKLGKPQDGLASGYYLGDKTILDADVAAIQTICDASNVSTLNTRVRKVSDVAFDLLIASSLKTLPSTYPATLTDGKITVTLIPADFAPQLAASAASLRAAIAHAANDKQRAMLEEYANSFESGDIEQHKKASSLWVKDASPTVESYIGFIEAYQDPYGVRAEWEGFVAVVNREQSRKFAAFVDIADEIVTTLPWGPNFEMDTFTKPDFTSLVVLSFATGGVPAGINIPNYSDIRDQGFKNVSLGNVLSAKAPNEDIVFIAPEEKELFSKWENDAFDVQVANHELLGHGSGKLFTASSTNVLNYDPQTINPLTGKPVGLCYGPGETYASRFGSSAASLEECRAEGVALYLASNRKILALFGFSSDEDAEAIIYYTFLLMVRAGIRALEFYDKNGKHGQAHMQARMGISACLIENGIASVELVHSPTGELIDCYARVDKAKVLSDGKRVMGELLLQIQTRRSTGAGEEGARWYQNLTTPKPDFLALRDLVISKKQARKILVQPTIELVDGEAVLTEHDASYEGVIKSFLARGI